MPLGVVGGPDGAAFHCAGCKQELVWRRGLAAPRTAVIPGRSSPTVPEVPAVAPGVAPPSPEPEMVTELAPVPAPRLPTPPGGVPLGTTGEHARVQVHHAFVSAELIAVPDEATPAPPATGLRSVLTPRLAIALCILLAFAAGGWAILGGSPRAVPAQPPAAEAPPAAAPPTPTPAPEPSPALVAALESRGTGKREAPERPARQAPKNPPPHRAVQGPRLSRPGSQPAAERTLNGKPVVLEYDSGPDSTAVLAPEIEAAVKRARGHYQRGNAKLFARDPASAIDAYVATIDAYPGYVAAYRGLGLALVEQGDSAKAAIAFRTYLRSAPGARDAALIKKVIEKLERAE